MIIVLTCATLKEFRLKEKEGKLYKSCTPLVIKKPKNQTKCYSINSYQIVVLITFKMHNNNEKRRTCKLMTTLTSHIQLQKS